MGESFLGLPNRFKVINNLLETTYNPTHALSAYQGYKLSTDYLNRSGGEDYKMTGPLYACNVLPTIDGSHDIGSESRKFKNIYSKAVYSTNFYGNATSASKLEKSRTIKLTGSVTGSVDTDLSGNVTINTTTNHNHDSSYVNVTGDTMTGTLNSRSVIPTSDITYSLGSSTKKYLSLYVRDIVATNIQGTLNGNATSASSLSSKPTIKIILESTTDANLNTGSGIFDGKNNLNITVKAPYLPISGGTLSSSLSVNGGITPVMTDASSGDVSTWSLGSGVKYWLALYVKNIVCKGDISLATGKLKGLATSSEKLSEKRSIKVVLNDSTDTSLNYGSEAFDGSEDITIPIWAPYLPISGGTIQGDIVPKTHLGQNLGSSSSKFAVIYAQNLFGTASYAQKLSTARAITIGNTARTFDGSADISWSLDDMGAAPNIGLGTLIEGRAYSGIYIVGTATGYLESAISVPPGIWLLEARVHHCIGDTRVQVYAVDYSTGSVVVEFETIQSRVNSKHYWHQYVQHAIYKNSGTSNVYMYIVLGTANIGTGGDVYSDGLEPSFKLNAIKIG